MPILLRTAYAYDVQSAYHLTYSGVSQRSELDGSEHSAMQLSPCTRPSTAGAGARSLPSVSACAPRLPQRLSSPSTAQRRAVVARLIGAVDASSVQCETPTGFCLRIDEPDGVISGDKEDKITSREVEDQTA